jgi:serpin B
MKRIIYTILSLVIILIMAGCGAQELSPSSPGKPTPPSQPVVTTPANPTIPVKAEFVSSAKTRSTSPAVASSDLKLLVDGNSTFAFALYQTLESGKNLFFSPYSISLALAMTYGGARGTTESQMASTLRFLLSQDRLHQAFNALDLQLGSRGQKSKDEEAFKLNIVNALWGQQGWRFLPSYLDLIAQNYGAGLRLLDFAKEPEPSRLVINGWVGDQTNNRIKDLIPPGDIDLYTRLVLANAIYFNASWQHPFSKDSTTDGKFYLLDESTVSVPMMKQMESFNYAKGENYEAVELPYSNGDLTMVLIVPNANQFQTFEKSLDTQTVSQIVSKLQPTGVNLTMPRFSFDFRPDLKQALKVMGMPDAFDKYKADFSGLDGKRDLFIGDALHKAFVSVDEIGTEAAAATAVIMEASVIRPSPAEMNINRPFIFLIRDIQTGTVLFIGRVINPAP